MRVTDGGSINLLSWMVGDPLGSTTMVTDDQGANGISQRYKAWGEVRPGPGNGLPTDYTFTGQQTVESIGLLFYVARWYDPTLSRFAQADTMGSGDRYAYVGNNPTNSIDPSGHERCDADGFCGDQADVGQKPPEPEPIIEEPPVLSADTIAYYATLFGIVFDSVWTIAHQLAVLQALLDVGNAFSEMIGGNAWTAFRSVFGITDTKKFVFSWGTGNGSLRDQCKGITDGGCTSSSKLINFVSTWGTSQNATYNVVHELGHAFNNLLWFTTPNGVRTRLPEYAVGNTPGLGRSAGGYAGRYGTWQQSTEDSPGENFADMFLGWTYGQWGKGNARSNFMNGLMGD